MQTTTDVLRVRVADRQASLRAVGPTRRRTNAVPARPTARAPRHAARIARVLLSHTLLR